jgi:hypothetical protein
MTEYSQGGFIPGTVEVAVLRGPRREAVNPGFDIYEDECIINRNGVCMRTDAGHASLPIPSDRIWVCPAHGDTREVKP